MISIEPGLVLDLALIHVAVQISSLDHIMSN